MSPRRDDPDLTPVKESIFDPKNIAVPIAYVGTAIFATWIIATKLNAIENRLGKIEWGVEQKVSRSQLREYNYRSFNLNEGKNKVPNVEEIFTQVP